MSYSENHKPIRKPASEDEHNPQFCQNMNKPNISNRQPPTKYQDNRPMNKNNFNQQSDGSSRLNYNSVPFTPKQQAQNIRDTKQKGGDKSANSVSMSHIMGTDESNYYQHGSNINYDAYGGSIPNQFAFNQNCMDFMPYLCQFPSNGTGQNYFQLPPNYNLPNLGLSSQVEPSQGMFMIGKSSENTFTTDGNFRSNNIQSNTQQFDQNKRHNQQTNKPNISGTQMSGTPVSATAWSPNSMEGNTTQIGKLSLDKKNYSTVVAENNENEETKAIINCVSDPELRKKLSETIRNVNPKTLVLKNLPKSSFFVMKSYSEDDLHRAIKYGAWCSTVMNNKKLDAEYKSLFKENGRLFLFFSVNGSGFFAGIAEMISAVNPDARCGFWTQSKWVGRFDIKWHYVKDVRNNALRHIRSTANDDKPVTNSRDGVQVLPLENGVEFIKVFHNAKLETSVFDDFEHYEQRQIEQQNEQRGNKNY